MELLKHIPLLPRAQSIEEQLQRAERETRRAAEAVEMYRRELAVITRGESERMKKRGNGL